MKVKRESEVAQSCPTRHDPMDCSLPGSSAHGIFQTRVLEWGAIAFSDIGAKSLSNSILVYIFLKSKISFPSSPNSYDQEFRCKECEISKMIKYLNLSLENPMDGGAWKTAVHGVAEGRTRLSDFTFTFHFHALEKEMATHSSVLAWRIPGTAEPGGLSSMGSHRVGHD